MKYAIIASAALPTAVWAVLAIPTAQPLVPRPVMTEGVRERRIDSETFRARWSTVADLPPATVMAYATETTVSSTRQVGAPPAHIRRARLDLCQRHHMRKVHYGRSWRCRR